MNQLVSFFAPTALPTAAGAAVRAQNGAQPGHFADILAQVQNTIATATGQPLDAATQQLLDQLPPGLLQAATNLSTDQIAAQLAAISGTPAGENPPQLKALLALLNGLTPVQPNTGKPAPSDASADTSLAAMLAALQLQTQSTPADPAQNQATTTPQSTATAAVVPTQTELGLRGSVAAAEQAPVPQAGPSDTPANAKAAENAAVALLAPNVTARPKNEVSPQQPPQGQPAKTSDSAKQKNQTASVAANTSEPNAAAADEPSGAQKPIAANAQPSTASQPAANAATPVQPNDNGAAQTTAPSQTQAPAITAAPAAPAFSNLIDAQQMSVTIQAAPQAAVPLEALAVQIARKFEAGVSQFEISLHPAELGQLDISLSVADDGRIQAVLRAERPETLDLLQRDARSLEQQLRQAGLEVGSNALSFSLSGGNGQQRHAPFTGWPAFAEAQDAAAAKQDAAQAYIAVRNSDGIDIRV